MHIQKLSHIDHACLDALAAWEKHGARQGIDDGARRLGQARGEIGACRKRPGDRATRRHEWGALLDATLYDPRALGATVSMAALWLHLGPFAPTMDALLAQRAATLVESQPALAMDPALGSLVPALDDEAPERLVRGASPDDHRQPHVVRSGGPLKPQSCQASIAAAAPRRRQ